ncbi:hypothetical protein FQR65_LT04845 [Abscondita terminalis]|nr:hypothetical protein FQR65_LT04845 [Abscondita terminalis]
MITDCYKNSDVSAYDIVTMKVSALVFLALLAFCACAKRYDNYQVYRITPRNDRQLQVLKELVQNPTFTLWSDISHVNRTVDVMVPPIRQRQIKAFLKSFDHELWIENVQTLIDNEGQLTTKADLNWNSYSRLETINSWMMSLPNKYPQVTVVQGGISYEGRPILGVKVSYKPGNKIVFLEGGIHAREWIAPATVTYILNQLLSSTDPRVRAVAESRDWYVFPNANPDGYVYSTNYDRMWRKTRKPYGFCYGADPNRNWGYHWMQGGASNNPCADDYAGPSAFSEIETKSLAEFISTIAPNLEAYIGFHSYSQYLLIPFGHSGLEVPANDAELHNIGYKAVAALSAKYGTRYSVGNIPEIIYVASGGSFDWVLGNYRHVRLAYTFELRDTGRYGFLLPPDQIIPTGRETLDALVVMIEEISN